METLSFNVSAENCNIVTVQVLESLFQNLDRIPLAELEKFINQYTQS
jgi:hypothetical protein